MQPDYAGPRIPEEDELLVIASSEPGFYPHDIFLRRVNLLKHTPNSMRHLVRSFLSQTDTFVIKKKNFKKLQKELLKQGLYLHTATVQDARENPVTVD